MVLIWNSLQEEVNVKLWATVFLERWLWLWVRRGVKNSGFISLVSCSAAALQLPRLPCHSHFLFTDTFCSPGGAKRASFVKVAQTELWSDLGEGLVLKGFLWRSLRSTEDCEYAVKLSAEEITSFHASPSSSVQDGDGGLRRSCASLRGSRWPVGVGCPVTLKPYAGGACLPPALRGPWRSPRQQLRAKKTFPMWRSSKCASLAPAPTWARTSNWSAVRRDGRLR